LRPVKLTYKINHDTSPYLLFAHLAEGCPFAMGITPGGLAIRPKLSVPPIVKYEHPSFGSVFKCHPQGGKPHSWTSSVSGNHALFTTNLESVASSYLKPQTILTSFHLFSAFLTPGTLAACVLFAYPYFPRT
jgi:hypothetical protein